MQCVDCHFDIDVHGNGKLYGEPRNATTINCIDCHGTIDTAPDADHDAAMPVKSICCKTATRRGDRASSGKATKLYQQSMMSPDVRWEIPQTIDTIDPASPHYNPKSAYAKTLRRDGKTWGDCSETAIELQRCQARSRTIMQRWLPGLSHAHGRQVVSVVICR